MKVFVVVYNGSQSLVGVFKEYTDAANKVYDMVQFGGYHQKDLDILEGDVV